MTQQDTQLYNLTRRKVLAGLGAVGLASAGAGLGTSAFFSDQETFLNNRLVAGSLDMKVDWEEHYSDWSDDETEYARMPTGDEDVDYALPPMTSNGGMIVDARPIELVFNGTTQDEKKTAKNGLWDATSVEAYPDGMGGTDYDGIQDEFSDDEACNILADVGLDDGGLTSDLRTEGEFAGQTTAPGDPLINISDVKPGDFGEVTFSFHLCDNPGYVWFNGNLVSAAENGHTEPEAEDPDEFGPADSTNPDDVELLDAIVTRLWYDPNCNNMVDLIAGDIDIMVAVDTSGSLNSTEMSNLTDGVEAFRDALPTDGSVHLGSLSFGNGAISDFQALNADPSTIDYSSLPSSGSGNTPLPGALDIAAQELENNGRAGVQKVVVVFTDGGPNYDDSYSANGYSAPRTTGSGVGYSIDGNSGNGYENSGGGNVTAPEEAETALVAETIRDAGIRIATVNVADNPLEDQGSTGVTIRDYMTDEIASSGFYFEIAVDNLEEVADDLVAGVAVSDEVFFQGTLREALAALEGNDGRGIPLDGDTATGYDELSDPENDPDRDCFDGAGVTHCLGFQWWLPINHANQIQTDSVAFDLGFYTEQCRHNDGSGMVPEETA